MPVAICFNKDDADQCLSKCLKAFDGIHVLRIALLSNDSHVVFEDVLLGIFIANAVIEKSIGLFYAILVYFVFIRDPSWIAAQSRPPQNYYSRIANSGINTILKTRYELNNFYVHM